MTDVIHNRAKGMPEMFFGHKTCFTNTKEFLDLLLLISSIATVHKQSNVMLR